MWITQYWDEDWANNQELQHEFAKLVHEYSVLEPLPMLIRQDANYHIENSHSELSGPPVDIFEPVTCTAQGCTWSAYHAKSSFNRWFFASKPNDCSECQKTGLKQDHWENLADQITLMLYGRFQKVKVREFIKYDPSDKTKAALRSPNVKVLADWFNDFALWIRVVILKAKTAQERWNRVKLFLDMAMRFKKNNDFYSLKAVQGALNTATIRKFQFLCLDPSRNTHLYPNCPVQNEVSSNHKAYIKFWEENGAPEPPSKTWSKYRENNDAYIPIIGVLTEQAKNAGLKWKHALDNGNYEKIEQTCVKNAKRVFDLAGLLHKMLANLHDKRTDIIGRIQRDDNMQRQIERAWSDVRAISESDVIAISAKIKENDHDGRDTDFFRVYKECSKANGSKSYDAYMANTYGPDDLKKKLRKIKI